MIVIKITLEQHGRLTTRMFALTRKWFTLGRAYLRDPNRSAWRPIPFTRSFRNLGTNSLFFS